MNESELRWLIAFLTEATDDEINEPEHIDVIDVDFEVIEDNKTETVAMTTC